MITPSNASNPRTSRREFIKSSALAGAAVPGSLAVPRPGYCAEDNTIKIALVGCGGRGTGAAAQALATQGPTKLWAMADAFAHRLDSSFNSLRPDIAEQLSLPR